MSQQAEDAPAEVQSGRPFPLGAGFILGFAIIGIGIATYLTILHYAKIPPVCSASNGTDWFSRLVDWAGFKVNCAGVTSSAESVIHGTNIPITVPGFLWFGTSGFLAGLDIWHWRQGSELPAWVPNFHMLVATSGLVVVIYLVYTEAQTLHQFCEWCTGVHLLILLTFGVVAFRWRKSIQSRYA